MSNVSVKSSVWIAAGVDSTFNAAGDVPAACEHRKVSVVGLSGAWDPGVVQLVAALRHRGVKVVDACQNAWGAGLSMLVLGSAADLEQASRMVGHVVPSGMVRHVVPAGLPEPTTGGLHPDWKGPWVSHGAGWAVGVVVRDGQWFPALVWPARLTAGLTQKLWRDFNLRPAPVRRRWFSYLFPFDR